jgi:hypothetical protein
MGPPENAELEGGWQLVGTDGEGRPVVLLLGESELARAYLGLTVGRHSGLCELCLEDPTVSRRHFRLSREGARLVVEDLNSLNGTFVDGRTLKPFEPAVLAAGQSLEVGRVVLTLRLLSDDTFRDDAAATK